MISLIYYFFEMGENGNIILFIYLDYFVILSRPNLLPSSTAAFLSFPPVYIKFFHPLFGLHRIGYC
jgi:hypothetical protein